MKKKPKVLRAVHANRGVEARYRKQLQALVAEMTNSVEHWVVAAYRKQPPRMAEAVAQDASPADFLIRKMRDLGKQWMKRFNEAAPRIARAYVESMFAASDNAFKSALADSGWAVDFTMTPLVRDALDATVGENVGLITSIPEQYLGDVEGIVMRSYTRGRDLETMTKELRARAPITQSRAELIARDQSNKANAVVNRARQTELGFTHAVWMHSHAGKNPRPDHVAANGKKYEIAVGCLVSGEHILPGEEINCRCSSRPILPF